MCYEIIKNKLNKSFTVRTCKSDNVETVTTFDSGDQVNKKPRRFQTVDDL